MRTRDLGCLVVLVCRMKLLKFDEILLSVRVDLSERAGAHVLANELHALAAIDLESLLEARLLVVSPVTAF